MKNSMPQWWDRYVRGAGRRQKALISVLGVLGTMIPVGIVVTATPASATNPAQVSFTLSGCRNDGTIVLPNGSGQFICPDTAYTTGNLGKGWNELDLVPFRLEAHASTSASSQTYTVAVVVDSVDAGHPGYDQLSKPVLNTILSDSSCTPPSVSDPAAPASPGLGGIDTSLYRLVTISQTAGQDCFYDYFARLAIGSHLFPGSSLHANLALQSGSTITTSGIGSKDVSIPVKEISPQELNKSASASKDSAVTWSATKTPISSSSPSNTCSTTASDRQGSVVVKIEWTKVSTTASGFNVVTTVTATNPASRDLLVYGNDVIKAGTSTLDTVTFGSAGSPITLGHNSSLKLVDAHVTTVDPSTLADPSAPPNFNDIATVNYVDAVFPTVTLPTLTATASVPNDQIANGNTANGTVDFSNATDLTGSNLQYSIDWVSATNPGTAGVLSDGSLVYNDVTGGTYTLGTATTRPTLWTLTGQTDSLTRYFGETVYAATAATNTGSLHDIAKVSNSGTALASDEKTISISPAALVSANVGKTMNQTFTGDKVFTFHLWQAGTPNVDLSKSSTVTITAGHTSGTSSTLTELDPTQTYFWKEDGTSPFVPKTTASFSYTLVVGDITSCTQSLPVDNNADPATAQVRKATLPNTDTSNWTFTLTGPNGLSETLTNVQANATLASQFTHTLSVDEGTYTITETQKSGWDNTGIAGTIGGSTTGVSTSQTNLTCSFVLDLTADSGKVFECDFTNTERGHLKVVKTVNGQTPDSNSSFTFYLRQGASASAAGTLLETGTANSGDSFTINFAAGLIPGTHYQLCEQLPLPGWATNLPNQFVLFSSSGDNSVVCTGFTVSPNQTLEIDVDNTPPPGGDAFTIGYWRNWASCAKSNGKQKFTLDMTLLAAANKGLPITIGTLVIDPTVLGASTACADAVSLLSKTPIGASKNKASDPLFNMAAQLTAAELNLAAGADSCTAIASAVTSAQALLVAYHFDGVSYFPKLTAADATMANQLATALDKYNNNLLC